MAKLWALARRAAFEATRCAAGVMEDEASLRAGSLAFSILFCAAPLGAMALGLASMFPKAFSFLPALYAKIAPRVLPSALDEAASAFSVFASNAENLSVASLALSVVSAFFLSMQLEKSVQVCWGARAAPEGSGHLARHWLSLTLSPCAMALLGWAAYETLAFAPAVGSGAASLALLFGFFLIATWALPAGRPGFLAAAVASALASVECIAIQSGFGFFWARSQSYGVIYGAAAVFLGALSWIWLFWLALLSSVSISSTLVLRRERDLDAAGLGFLAPLWTGADLIDGAATPVEPGPASEAEAVGLPMALETKLLASLGADAELADPAAYARILDGREGVAPLREALGGACAAKAAREMIERSLLAGRQLANGSEVDNIDSKITHSPPTDSPFPRTPP